MTNSVKTGLIWGAVALAALGIIIALIAANSSSPSTVKAVPDAMTVAANDWTKGNKDAKIIITEYSDFQCPACRSYETLVKQVTDELGGTTRFVYRYFPLQMHKNGQISAQAAEAAGKQGKFWEMHDMLFDRQDDWAEKADAKDLFVTYAGSLGLNQDQFKKDLTASETKKRVEEGTESGNRAGVEATPTFFVNGQKLAQPRDIDDFKKAVAEASAKLSASTMAAPEKTEGGENNKPAEEAYHIHFDIAIYSLGKKIDLSQAKYQSVEGKELDEFVHLHDGNGEVVHIHKAGVTLGDLFKSLTKPLADDSCVATLDTSPTTCGSKPGTLKVYVNGKVITDPVKYVPQDLDRVMVSFGNEAKKDLDTEVTSVTDKACIYSLKCPERGAPPAETCVGGIGTVCK